MCTNSQTDYTNGFRRVREPAATQAKVFELGVTLLRKKRKTNTDVQLNGIYSSDYFESLLLKKKVKTTRSNRMNFRLNGISAQMKGDMDIAVFRSILCLS